MGKNTKVSWCDSTFNPWIGCTKVSPGCDHCYAESLNRRWGKDNWGKGKQRVVTSDSNWRQPIVWNRDAAAAGEQRSVFCGSLCDVMDDEAPIGARARLYLLIEQTPHLLWLLLTKRPHRYKKYLPINGFSHNNVMLGATTESQPYYNVRMPQLHEAQQTLDMANDLAGRNLGRIQTFISYEPAIGPLSIQLFSGICPDWLIFGGETGSSDSQRRPCELEWAENVKMECDARGVAFFMKQMGARTPDEAAALIPAHMLVQKFPEVR